MVEQTCGELPSGVLCRFTLDRTGDAELAALVDTFLGVPVRIAVIVLVALLVLRVGRRAIARFSRRYEAEIHRRVRRAEELGVDQHRRRLETRRRQRLHAMDSAGRSALAIVVGVTAALLVLAEFVDLGPVLAGAGLAGLVVGFGAQSLIADLLAGFSMLVEDAYGVGDWIDVDGRIGEVERVGLRTTSFRDIDGIVWHVPNGRINGVGNLTQRWARATLDVPLALDTDIAHARRVVDEVAHELATDPAWSADVIARPEIWGVTAWGPEGLALRLVIPTRPLRNWDINRQMRERLKTRFEREGIRMPVPQRDLAGRATSDVPVAMRVARPQRSDDDPGGPTSVRAEADERVHDTGRIATEYGRIVPREPDG